MGVSIEMPGACPLSYNESGAYFVHVGRRHNNDYGQYHILLAVQDHLSDCLREDFVPVRIALKSVLRTAPQKDRYVLSKRLARLLYFPRI